MELRVRRAPLGSPGYLEVSVRPELSGPWERTDQWALRGRRELRVSEARTARWAGKERRGMPGRPATRE